MENLILKTKFVPPKLNKNLWKKDKLWNKYNQMDNYSLTVLKAGPGYGKSTTLSSFLKNNYSNSFYWYSIDKTELDSVLFFLNLIHAFNFSDTELGKETIKLFKKNDKQKIELKKFIDFFINELLSNLDKRSFLVIDDYHLVNDNQEINDLLTYFIEMKPPNLHVIISTRQKLKFKELSRWRLKQKVLLINQQDLVLTKDEVNDFLDSQYKLELANECVEQIYNKTEGWIMALDLVCQNITKTKNIKKILSESNDSLELLFEYLAFEILEEQSKEIKNFLLKTSVLNYLRLEVCNDLLNIKNSEEILEKLVSKGLFIYEVGEEQYRYHHLFHDFLQKQVHKFCDYDDLHKQAAKIFKEKGEERNALIHSLAINDYNQAAELIISGADKLLKVRSWKVLQESLDQLPEEVFSDYPLLFLCQGDIYRVTSKFNQAIKFYKRAEKEFRKNNASLNLVRTFKKIALVYLDTVQPSKASKYLEQALDLINKENLNKKTTLLEMMAENELNKGNLMEARNLYRKTREFDEFKVIDNNLKARVYLRTGQLNRTQNFLQDKLTQEKEQKGFPKSHRETYLILSLIHSMKGEVKEAIDYANRGISLGKKLKFPFIEAVSYARLAHAYQLSQFHNIDQIRELYFKSIEIMDNISVPRGKVEALMGLGTLETFYGEAEKGFKYLKKGIQICNKAGDDWMTGWLKISFAINQYFNNNLVKAENIFSEAGDIFIRSDDHFSLAVCRLWRSLIAYQQQNLEDFKEKMEKLFSITSKYDYDYLYYKGSFLASRDPNLFTPILLKALELDIGGDYIYNLIDKLGLNNLERHPGYSLRIRSFGELKVYRGRNLIKDSDWSRKKAKELFKLFIVYHDQLISKEEICYFLWPDASKEKAKRNFSVVLNSLNKVLEPTRKARETPVFIKREGSKYGFNKDFLYILDIEKFKNLIKKAKRQVKEKDKVRYYELACKMYQGEFLADTLYLDCIRNEREKLKNYFLNAKDELIKYYYKQGEFKECIKNCNQILQSDKYWETAYLYKMKSHYQLDRSARAIKVYNKCKSVLQEDLKVSPSSKIKKLYKKIKM